MGEAPALFVFVFSIKSKSGGSAVQHWWGRRRVSAQMVH